MTNFRVFPVILSASAVMPVAALADVTAEDVLTNMMAPARALGFDVTAEPVREGDSLRVESMVMTYALPMDAGEARLSSNGFTLTEQGDGSVALSYSEGMTAEVTFTLPDEGEVMSATLTYEGFDTPTIATGTPGQVSYEGAFENARFALTDFTVPDEGVLDVSVQGTLTGTSRYEITEGDIVKVSMSTTSDTMTFDTKFSDPEGAVSSGTQKMTGGTSELEMAIPAGQIDLLNLDDALRAGLMLVARTGGMRVDGTTVTKVEDTEMRQATAYTMDSNDISLGEDGLSMSGVYTDFAFEFLMPPDLPFPIAGEIARSEGRVTAPLTETDGAVPVEVRMTLEEVSLDEAIWALFDGQEQLPRDPMTVVLDLSGEAALSRDPLDIMRMMEVPPAEETLGRIESLRLNELVVRAVGAELTGSGAFEIDNEDYETFPGMPAPSGSVDLRVSGANGLIDTLVAMGLVPEEQAMGTRMMLGMFGAPGEGEDVITSTIEVTEDGQVLANGQRLR
ncbi:DUF2125 domain-containing protein [Roseovarius sp. B08]|uniref:DUF2125 domain-containing protein n=1 Tax=Roseovarius sp. B08 TaxID=3449223 RepID=UPI003EDC9A7E